VWISEQTAIISLYSINRLVCITETESVYCAVRTGSLNQTDTVLSLKGAGRSPGISLGASVMSEFNKIFPRRKLDTKPSVIPGKRGRY